jgi:hypothetical protein
MNGVKNRLRAMPLRLGSAFTPPQSLPIFSQHPGRSRAPQFGASEFNDISNIRLSAIPQQDEEG